MAIAIGSSNGNPKKIKSFGDRRNLVRINALKTLVTMDNRDKPTVDIGDQSSYW